MLKRVFYFLPLLTLFLFSGCATVPMEPAAQDTARKQFSSPPQGFAGLYIYRNSTLGAALKKSLYIDDILIGETAPKTYFYKNIKPGNYQISTESEFSNNSLTLAAKEGQNYFVRQYIKFGLFVGGAGLRLISEEEGKKGVLECKLAKPLNSP